MVSKHCSRRFITSLIFVLVSLIFAALLRRMELMAAALPFFTAVVISMLTDRAPSVDFTHSISRTTVFENDVVRIELEVIAKTRLPHLEVMEPLPQFGVLHSGANDIVSTFAAGERQLLRYELRVNRRSRFTLGRISFRVYSDSGLFYWEGEWADPKICICYPSMDMLSHPIRPFHTQVNVGNYPSRVASEGIEFASIRQYVSGDQLRTVNWRVSQRSGRMFVNEFTRERNADIVLLIDSFSDSGSPGQTVLDGAVRVCASLSNSFLQNNNRVGFIEFSGIMNWIMPDLGTRQWYRILERLTDVRERESDVAKDITMVPRQILPSQALIVAFTPLIDERFTVALLDLASRRYDIAAVVIDPATTFEVNQSDGEKQAMALRIWSMETELSSQALGAANVPIIAHELSDPVELLAQKIDMLRRRRAASR